jgi:N-methylhydantoinase A/oxoprolinase/acetone carboxylase beta subunit
MRLVSRGLVMISGVTPSDASHGLGRLDCWDAGAASKALALFAKRRNGHGDRIAAGPEALAQAIVDQLTAQTVDCLLEAAFAEDGRDWGEAPERLARHTLMRAALDGYHGVLGIEARLGVPVIGLGASAPSYYGAVGERLRARMVLPEYAGVANAIGAVVGQVAIHIEGTVTSPAAGLFIAHTPDGPARFGDRDQALLALEQALSGVASDRARRAGVEEIRLVTDRELSEIAIEGRPMFIEARLRVTAKGRPRIATG